MFRSSEQMRLLRNATRGVSGYNNNFWEMNKPQRREKSTEGNNMAKVNQLDYWEEGTCTRNDVP